MSSRKYSIGFVIVSLIIMVLLSAAYRFSYQAAVDRAAREQEEEVQPNAAVLTEGQATKNDGYYLMEQNGYVIVCLQDKKAVYEYTSIEVTELPITLQNEVKNGKYIKTLEELYGFLENYSS